MNAPEYIQNLDDLDLLDLISQQGDILDCCIESACNAPDVRDFTGLYFAGLHYMWSVSELEKRFGKYRKADPE